MVSKDKDYSQYITKKPDPEDQRPFLIRLLTSIRPKFSFVKDKRTGKTGASIQITGGTDF